MYWPELHEWQLCFKSKDISTLDDLKKVNGEIKSEIDSLKPVIKKEINEKKPNNLIEPPKNIINDLKEKVQQNFSPEIITDPKLQKKEVTAFSDNPNKENTKTETSDETIGAEQQSGDKHEGNKGVEEEEKELSPEEKIKELEDKLARTFAEMENQRRRFEKEKDDAFDYGGFAFAKEALNLIDNLARSKLILESDEALKDTEALKKTLEHFDIINKDLISIFTKNNIKPIDCLNKKLDPNLHQAMMEIEDDQKEPGTIVQEVQKGFMIKDRLLRPSLVGVSKKIETKDDKSEENKENLDK